MSGFHTGGVGDRGVSSPHQNAWGVCYCLSFLHLQYSFNSSRLPSISIVIEQHQSQLHEVVVLYNYYITKTILFHVTS